MALTLALAAMAGVVAPAPALAGTGAVPLDTLNAADLRLASVGYRLATANPGRCATPAMLTGMILHDLGQYAAKERDAVAQHYRISDGIGLLGVVPDSAADRAGLRAGDEIIGIGDADVRVAPSALPRTASYDRLDRVAATVKAAIAHEAVPIRVRRGDETLRVMLGGVAGCGGDMVLAPSRVFNAWSDGAHVVVTMRLLAAAADDDELAFIVAHEMSHNNLRHQERLGGAANGLFASFGRTASRIKQTEIEADAAAIGLMSAAGYRLEAAASFLARAGKGRLLDIATTHPGTGRRISIVTAAIEVARTPIPTSLELAGLGSWPELPLGTSAAFTVPALPLMAAASGAPSSVADAQVVPVIGLRATSPLANTLPCAVTPNALNAVMTFALPRVSAAHVAARAWWSRYLQVSPWPVSHPLGATLLPLP